ncbi:IclR family transcriptional regulator [Natrarchaeobius halalkaliphilus]|uniref:IclR family transcriptional regulator n=1 Tax=Natrarchaeobius halalkaliphilus TaxID=1679091 RepID=A0A3N6LXG3_9EURY|nr:IclR family transcriptional regulator [Natrarchaeobius halalkaliphilus]RQG86741.1 IclR family transcriptional regulator [Natrarchaeobius halalkaliphilus]
MSENANHPVTTSQKTIRILETIFQENGGTLTELASELGMNKSTTHNHLTTLVDEELVVRDGAEYRLGLRLLEFGGYARNQHALYQRALPEIERLAEQTGEIANLVIEEHGHAVYLACETGEQAVNIDVYPGLRRPLQVTASGKAILASLSPDRVDEIVDRHGLPAKTPNSITTQDELEASLAAVRDRGIAFDDEEHIKGLRCVGAPIHDSNGEVLGAVSVSGPASRMTDGRFYDEFPSIVNSTLNVIELNINQKAP